jgi:hypothetical protein
MHPYVSTSYLSVDIKQCWASRGGLVRDARAANRLVEGTSGSGPSGHAVRKWMMVAFGAKRTYVVRPGARACASALYRFARSAPVTPAHGPHLN